MNANAKANTNTDDFLFELGLEELPTDCGSPLSLQLKEKFSKLLTDSSLKYKNIKTFTAPRRIAILISELDLTQPEQTIERKGPSLKACFDKDNNPTKALSGFLQSLNLKDHKSCETLKTEKGEWILYKGVLPAQDTANLLPKICEKVIKSLILPRSMKWHTGEYEFIRPVHWLVALLGNKVINLNLFGVKADNKTHGHRFHNPDSMLISHANKYEDLLINKGYVIPDSEKRKQKILEQINKCLEKHQDQNWHAEINPDLLEEVTHLVSWPNALLCPFSKDFLKTPKPALTSSMEYHQKCFPISNSNNILQPAFITICNIDSKNPESVIHGNQIVMTARLSDATFFYEKDKQITFSNWQEKLKHISFQDGLGSIYDKAIRTEKLAVKIANNLKSDNNLISDLKTAASLYKCDLVSDMVEEFPKLQGIMGEIYANNQNYSKNISTAIRESYLPRFAEDKLPESQNGQILSLADKLDTICALFSINQAPKGNKDPFALRRQALGIIRILYANSINISIPELITNALSNLNLEKAPHNCANLIQDFIIERLKNFIHDELENKNLNKNYFEAILATNTLILSEFKEKLNALSKFMEKSDCSDLITVNKRIRRILLDHDQYSNDINILIDNINPNLFDQKSNIELELFDQLKNDINKSKSINLINQLDLFSKYAKPLNNLFDNIMVMDKDNKIKDNRLQLLKAIRIMILKVADISLI